MPFDGFLQSHDFVWRRGKELKGPATILSATPFIHAKRSREKEKKKNGFVLTSSSGMVIFYLVLIIVTPESPRGV